jgi:hypothetical protein
MVSFRFVCMEWGGFSSYVPCRLCVYESPSVNLWIPEPIFMKADMSVMAPESISTAYFISPSHQFVSICVSLLSLLGKVSVKCIPPFIARQRLSKHVPTATNMRNNRRIVGRVCLWVCLCIPLSLLGNNSVKAFPLQRRIVGVVFYDVRVVSKESRKLVLLRTSFWWIQWNIKFELRVSQREILFMLFWKHADIPTQYFAIHVGNINTYCLQRIVDILE